MFGHSASFIFIIALIITTYGLPPHSCDHAVSSIDKQYFQGIVKIGFWEKEHYNKFGEWWPGVIHVYGGCDVAALKHELAHQMQWNDGDRWKEVYGHGGKFGKELERLG